MHMKLIAISLLAAGMAGGGAFAQSAQTPAPNPQATDPGVSTGSEPTNRSPNGSQGEPLNVDPNATNSTTGGTMNADPNLYRPDCQNQRSSNTETSSGSHQTQGQVCN